MLGSRNKVGLSAREIENCVAAWRIICNEQQRLLDISEADAYASRTRYNQARGVVILGADAYSGLGSTANSRLSLVACLAHELAHAQRFELGYDRPVDAPDSYVDEAEASLRASFNPALSRKDREDLIEDARDRLNDWLREA
jgi:hypothetical protein